jgi:2-polyprenyl-3-methyl-5-hydroxy-6-metoxy-1,4-benzoquinol methylase
LIFLKNGYPIIECKKCGLRFVDITETATHLSQVYSDKYFFEGNDGYPNYLEEKDILIRHGEYYAKKISKYSKPGSVLDVGCAAGFIMQGFENKGWEVYGIEPNKKMAEYGRSVLKLNIQEGGLETYNSSKTFDVITLIQVIGHFYDIHLALENASKLLNPEGFIIVESWNMNSLVARMLGKNWHEYCPPSVINWFSETSLQKLFTQFGFEKVESGFPRKRIRLKTALSILNRVVLSNNNKMKLIPSIMNSIGNFTLYYPPVDLKWYVFGKR